MASSKLILVLFLAGHLAAHLHATTFYVATNGNDSNSGTSTSAPFATPQKAVTLSALAAGDTIYVRGGNYAFSTQVKPSRTGAAGNPIKLWAYPGEFPVWDFATMPAGSTKALDTRKDYWHIKGIEVKNGPDSGILIAGSGTIIEGCVVHDCGNDGFIFGSTSIRATNALILNCDSYRNFDPASGGNNGDGFGAKTGCGPGNVFRGCRAFYNADDGWDCYDNDTNTVTFENCWSFHNGTNLWNVSNFSGNGNGFKLGGAGTHAGHLLKNCLAFDNHSKGFDHNLSAGAHTLYNCTGFRNAKWNFSFYDAPAGGADTFKNNVSYLGQGTNIVAGAVMVANSWQGFTVTAADFASVSDAPAFAPRNADYSLPANTLARLAAGSDLIDAGVNVGLPFNGAAPDLGAYEFTASISQGPIWFQSWRATNGGFSLTVTGLTSHGAVVLSTSSNLTSWTPLLTNPAATGTTQFLDPVTNRAARFYRAEEK